MLVNGDLRQLRRSVVLGSVAELPKRGDAQMRLDERLRPINMGAGRPEAFMEFGTDVPPLLSSVSVLESGSAKGTDDEEAARGCPLPAGDN
jgi:hypothetical protein